MQNVKNQGRLGFRLRAEVALLQKQVRGQGPIRASHTCLEQTDSSGNQQMTTAATKDANFKHSSRYPGSLYDQARKHVIRAHSGIQEQINESAPQTGSSRVISQYKKEESRGRQSKIKPSSARGVSCNDQKMEDSMDGESVSPGRHKRNKTLTSYNQPEDITEKQSKLFGEIENLKTELHTLIYDENEEISSQFAQEFFKNSNRYEQEKREAAGEGDLNEYSFMGSQEGKVLMTEEEGKVEEQDLRFEKALAQFFHQPDLESFQTLLDHASEEGNDVLAFKDTKGKVWEIVEHISDDEEEQEDSEQDSQDGEDPSESIQEQSKQESPMKFQVADQIDPQDFKLSTSGYADRPQQFSKDEIEAKKVSLSILSLEEENDGSRLESEQKWRQFY